MRWDCVSTSVMGKSAQRFAPVIFDVFSHEQRYADESFMMFASEASLRLRSLP